jgi:hypothetical protein
MHAVKMASQPRILISLIIVAFLESHYDDEITA